MAGILGVDRRLDIDGKLVCPAVTFTDKISDAGGELVEHARIAAQVVVDLGVRAVDRDVDVEGAAPLRPLRCVSAPSRSSSPRR